MIRSRDRRKNSSYRSYWPYRIGIPILVAVATVASIEIGWRILLELQFVDAAPLRQLEEARITATKGYESETSEPEKENDLRFLQFELHPFLGFVSLNRTLESEVLEELRSSARVQNSYRIALLGGSVASSVSYLLRENLRTALPDKNVSFVSLATGAYGQPQQLISFVYLLALGYRPDLVINLDGVNEIGVPRQHQIRSGMAPTIPQLWPILASRIPTVEYKRHEARTAAVRFLQHRLALGLQNTPIVRESAVVLTLWYALHTMLEQERVSGQLSMLTESGNEHKTRSLSGELRELYSSDDSARTFELIRIWLDSSLLIRALCEIHSCHYIHFLQPNPHVPKGKSFSREEESFVNDRGELAITVRRFYSSMRDALEKVTGPSGAAVDASKVFAEVNETVYTDDCCHLNENGKQILVRFMKENISAFLSYQPADSMETNNDSGVEFESSTNGETSAKELENEEEQFRGRDSA